MTAEAEEGPDATPMRRGRWSRRRKATLILFLMLIASIGALWSQRRPIVRGFIERELERRGVAARYDVAEIGPTTQRLDHLVIGDPRNPDLVADRVIVRTRLRFGLPEVTAIEARHVRLRGRWVDGRLSLGAIDRLMPPPSGKPLTLPALNVKLDDARARIDTPAGVIGLRISGGGRLDDGFAGRIAAVSRRLEGNGCTLMEPRAALSLRTVRRTMTLDGPVRIATGQCGDISVAATGVALTASLPESMDRWNGEARLNANSLRAPGVGVTTASGGIRFAGTSAATQGTVDLRAAGVAAAQARIRAASLVGRYAIAGSSLRFAGQAGVDALAASPAAIRAIDARQMRGMPGGALAAQAADALKRAASDLSGSADIALRVDGGRGAVVARGVEAESASGARMAFAGERGIGYGWPGGRLMLDGRLNLSGGGLPEAELTLVQAGPGAPLSGRAVVAPYSAGGEKLALTPIVFSRDPGGGTRARGQMRVSVALPGGWIDELAMPIDLRWDGGQRVALAPGCMPLAFQRLSLSGLELRAGRLRLCPLGDTLLRAGPGGLQAGARIAAPKLSGRLGGSPIDLTAARADVRLARQLDFTLADVAVRLGTPERVSRLAIGTLDGGTTANGVGGTFADTAGAIGNVPLDLSEGAGDWRFAGGQLSLNGKSLRVADAAPEPRFEPLAADDFVLELAGNRIDAKGTLTVPVGGARVAGVTIGHDLGRGVGEALLAVDGLDFGERLQPDQLTKLVFGVIADVQGRVSGTGRIGWTPEGVTSDGVFRTSGIDLAAAFGPVTGIAGELRFTDLLGLKTAPATATIAVANPGIPVENGTVRYQLIGEQRVAVESGRWPFAGGAMVLEPTILDLSEGKERRMTFRVEGVDAASFLQQFDFKNLNATGTFDGTLPMIFDERGGRIENGRLAMREGGGTLAYVGEVSKENLGTWGNFAFEALKSLHYDNLNLVMNGPLDGEMLTEIRFSGVRQGEGAKSNFLVRRLARLPLVFNVTVKAPFRQLIDSVQSYYDPTRLIQRNLPALLEQQRKAKGVQPPASENMP